MDDVPMPVEHVSRWQGRPKSLVGQACWVLYNALALRRRLRSEQPAVVMVFLWLPALIFCCASFMLPRPPRLVWSMQTDLLRQFAGTIRGRMIQAIIHRFLLPRVDAFVAPSAGVKQILTRTLGVPPERVNVIANGLDQPRILRLSENGDGTIPAKTRFRVVTVGRLVHDKAYDDLLDAFEKFCRRCDAELIIAGEGPERPRLVKKIGALGLGDRAVLSGFLTNPYPLIRSGDVFVSSSRWESFGVAIAEALTLGVPVIATQTLGARDLVKAGRTGLLVPLGDIDALERAMHELAHNPELRMALGSQASVHTSQWSRPEVAERHARLLEGLIGVHMLAASDV